MQGCIERSRSPPLAASGRGDGFPSTLSQSPGPWISPGFTRAVHHLLQAYSYVFVMYSGYDVSYSSPVINHTQPVYATARPPRRRCQSRLSVGIRIAVYLSVCSKISIFGDRSSEFHWVIVYYQIQTQTFLFDSKQLMFEIFESSHWGGFGRQAEEVKWIVPPRAAPAVKNAGVEVWWCVGGSLATPLMIYSEFDVH